MLYFLDSACFVFELESWEITWEQNGLFDFYNYIGCQHNFLRWFTEM